MSDTLSGQHFFGKPFEYWVELQKTKTLSESELIMENATLRAKCSFYEHHLDMVSAYRSRLDGGVVR